MTLGHQLLVLLFTNNTEKLVRILNFSPFLRLDTVLMMRNPMR